MVASTPQTRKLLEMNDEVAQQYGVQSAKLAPQFYYRALDLCNTCDLNYRNASSKQLLVELTLVKLCQLIVAPQPQQAVQQPISKITPSTSKPAQQSAPAATEPPLTVTPPTSSRIIRPAEPVQAPHPAEQSSTPPAPDVQLPPQQPRPAAPSPTASRPLANVVGKTPRIMVNVSNASVQRPQASALSGMPQRTQPFSAEQLNAAWQNYIDQHPQERALCTTMSYALPQPGEQAEHYVMIVGSSTELKNVEEHKQALLKFLSDQLQNDRLTLDVKVSDVPIDTPKILSPREVVEEIKQHNPNFTQFLKDFDLGLA